VLLLRELAVLPFTANAREVESDEQVLVPFCTLTSLLMLTQTSPPWARATPGIAIIATIIAVAVNTNRLRLIETSSLSLRAG
jgi:hypothetical protein